MNSVVRIGILTFDHMVDLKHLLQSLESLCPDSRVVASVIIDTDNRYTVTRGLFFEFQFVE